MRSRPTKGDAAGAVLWRRAVGTVEVALVHRPRYDDLSLPKGHLEPGEHPALAALREVAEETGQHATLGRFLGRTAYQVEGRTKQVRYWAARAGGGTFTPNDETDGLRWLTCAQARDALSYPADAGIVAAFARVPAATSTLLLVRHAEAEPAEGGRSDAARGLTARGRAQATALVPLLRAFGVSEMHAAGLRRCVETAQPLAEVLKTRVQHEAALPEPVYATDRAGGLRRFDEIRQSAGVSVVFSQDVVIPDVLRSWATQATTDTRTPTATTWVVSSFADEVVGLDRLSDPLR